VKSKCSIIANDVFPAVDASRILGKGALKGGMPWYKYVANRVLTLFQNILINQKLSEYHTGYRAFDTRIFNKIDIEKNSDDFVFDNQMTAQVFFAGFEIGEVTCPTKYFDDAS
ncbi:MAG: glycosyltransferase family 2 protein, partial [Bacteroidia bacterium]